MQLRHAWMILEELQIRWIATCIGSALPWSPQYLKCASDNKPIQWMVCFDIIQVNLRRPVSPQYYTNSPLYSIRGNVNYNLSKRVCSISRWLVSYHAWISPHKRPSTNQPPRETCTSNYVCARWLLTLQCRCSMRFFTRDNILLFAMQSIAWTFLPPT